LDRLFIILGETPFQSELVNHVYNIANTALEMNHEVSIFLFMDGVYNMLNTQSGENFKVKPSFEELQALIDKGAKITCCRLCKELRGVTDSLISSDIITSGVALINDEIEDSDVVLSFLGWS